MPKTYTISKAEAEEICKLRKGIKRKDVDDRLKAVQRRGEGKENEEIAQELEVSSDTVSRWVGAYANGGVEALMPKPRPGRPLAVSFEEVEKMLKEFEEKANAGQVVEVSEIKAAYEEKVGHAIGGGHIYHILKRHKWRKDKPRSRHPKKASDEVIEASKKLTTESEK